MRVQSQTLQALYTTITEVNLQLEFAESTAYIRLTIAVALFPLRELHLTRPLLDDIAVGDACTQNPDVLSDSRSCQCVPGEHQLQQELGKQAGEQGDV